MGSKRSPRGRKKRRKTNTKFEALGKIFTAFLAERTKSWRRDAPAPYCFVAIDNLLGEPLSIKDLVLTRALSGDP